MAIRTFETEDMNLATVLHMNGLQSTFRRRGSGLEVNWVFMVEDEDQSLLDELLREDAAGSMLVNPRKFATQQRATRHAMYNFIDQIKKSGHKPVREQDRKIAEGGGRRNPTAEASKDRP